jgi:hypothetical protein
MPGKRPTFCCFAKTHQWAPQHHGSLHHRQLYFLLHYQLHLVTRALQTATNDCGSVTAFRSFRTRDEHPPRCATCDEQTYLTAGNSEGSAAPAKSIPPGFDVLPNPNAGNFDVYYVSAESAVPLTTSPPTFALLDMLGRTVAAGSLTAPTTHVATSQVSTGVYLLLKIVDHTQTRYKCIQIIH